MPVKYSKKDMEVRKLLKLVKALKYKQKELKDRR